MVADGSCKADTRDLKRGRILLNGVGAYAIKDFVQLYIDHGFFGRLAFLVDFR